MIIRYVPQHALAFPCLPSLLIAALFAMVAVGDDSAARSRVAGFLETHCYDCHQGEEAEAGLDLASLGFDLSDAKVQQHWVRIIDRIRSGEMPPADSAPPRAEEKKSRKLFY